MPQGQMVNLTPCVHHWHHAPASNLCRRMRCPSAGVPFHTAVADNGNMIVMAYEVMVQWQVEAGEAAVAEIEAADEEVLEVVAELSAEEMANELATALRVRFDAPAASSQLDEWEWPLPGQRPEPPAVPPQAQWVMSIQPPEDEPAKPAAKPAAAAAADSDSDSGSDSDSSDDKATSKPAAAAAAESDSSSDDDDDDDSDSSDDKPAAKQAATAAAESSDSSSDEEESEATVEATEPAAKKQRTNAGDSREATEQRVPTPFKRVDAAAIEAEFGWGDSSKVEGHKLIDNSWDALRAKGHTYADKAQERLGPVKGKDFRKQMTKAKRGTYMCGAIDGNAVNSIKYPDSD